MSKAAEFKKWYSERMGHPEQIKLAHEAILELEKKLEDLSFDAEQVFLYGFESKTGNWTPKKATLDNLELQLKRLQRDKSE